MRTQVDVAFGKEMNTKVVLLLLCFASAGFSEDFKTINGKEYKDATVSRVEPDGIVLATNSGVAKVYFTELPKDVQSRFGYDLQKATAYSAEQTANYATYQKQQDESRRERADAAAKNNAILAEQQAATNRIQTLENRYAELQQEENATLLKIGEAKQPGPAYWGGSKGRILLHHANPQKSQLPLLESHLKDVRREKDQVRKRLEKAQP